MHSKAQGDAFKLLIWFNQPSKTQRYQFTIIWNREKQQIPIFETDWHFCLINDVSNQLINKIVTY